MKKAPSRLEPILNSVRAHAQERRRVRSLESLRAELVVDPGRAESFRRALGGPGLAIIAECKRSAPSVGELSTEVDLARRIEAYARGGADALSILTERDHFRGDLRDLQAAPGVALPRLRKDFVLDEGMLLESQLAGASAVLLIVACLPTGLLEELREQAQELGLAVLMEVHNEQELEVALPLAPDALGVNARNLTTFELNLEVTERLLPRIPREVLKVAESGMHTREDLMRMARAGADAALVGTALMRSPRPTSTLREWKERLGG